MTIGNVGSNGDVIVELAARAPGREQGRSFEAVLDTGFNGSLALPPDLIEALGLDRLGQEELILASGAKHFSNRYEAIVSFGGEVQDAEILEAGEALVGAGLLRGYELRVRYTEGGRVEIEALGG